MIWLYFICGCFVFFSFLCVFVFICLHKYEILSSELKDVIPCEGWSTSILQIHLLYSILFYFFSTFSSKKIQRFQATVRIADVTDLILYSLGNISIPIKKCGYISSAICLFVSDAFSALFSCPPTGKALVFALYFFKDFSPVHLDTDPKRPCGITCSYSFTLKKNPWLDWLEIITNAFLVKNFSTWGSFSLFLL